ncbi:hydrogenase maturation protease [Allochromatium tepidum]|uniref:Transposase n=1 Tax=Allochromatium tepidum TaxID=553982 RepID=A0ABM7QK03_9GAMM|nr:hydrogenase maturation protease [Allochromatium tepidum]BCU06117.1 hypothetical protein Atep_07940 [Allochromatium tepidum]
MIDCEAVYCDVDDFCQVFPPAWHRRLLTGGERRRRRAGRLTLSEILTILIVFHQSQYRTFKAFSLLSLSRHARGEFPSLVGYTRFVALIPQAFRPLCFYRLPPGTLKRVEGDEVPKFMGAKKMSLHQTGFQEVLALADLLGDYPRHLLLIGVQPVELDDFGGSLRPEVKAQIEPAIGLARAYLESFGIDWEDCETSEAADYRDLPHPSLGLDVYESGRPRIEMG